MRPASHLDIPRAAGLVADEVVELCSDLIKARSHSGDEGAVARLLLSRLDRSFDEVSTDRLGNVVARLEGGGGPAILFDGHMDTVPAGAREDWSCEPYGGGVSDGRVWGRGAVDMKGSLAAMAFLGEVLAKAGADPPGDRIVAFVVQEEACEGLAIRHLLDERRLPEPGLVVLGEATGLGLGVGHRGRAEVTITTRGHTAHASMPHLGENALLAMADVLVRLGDVPLPSHEALGEGTHCPVSVRCSPGDGPVVPDRCTLELDRRVVLGETAGSVVREYRQLLSSLGLGRATAELRRLRLRCYTGLELEAEGFYPAWRLDPSSPLAQGCRAALASVGLEAAPRAWSFSTDGAYTAGVRGIPTLGFGPGDESLAHRPDESVATAELVRAAAGYAAIAASSLRPAR